MIGHSRHGIIISICDTSDAQCAEVRQLKPGSRLTIRQIRHLNSDTGFLRVNACLASFLNRQSFLLVFDSNLHIVSAVRIRGSLDDFRDALAINESTCITASFHKAIQTWQTSNAIEPTLSIPTPETVWRLALSPRGQYMFFG